MNALSRLPATARPSAIDLPAGTVDLVSINTMLNGQQIETARQAYDTAVMVANHALDLAHSDVCHAVEPLHDALSRFAALSQAGLLKVIS